MLLQGPIPSLAQYEDDAYSHLPEPRTNRLTLVNRLEGSTSHQASVQPVPLPSLLNQAPRLGLENSSILRPARRRMRKVAPDVAKEADRKMYPMKRRQLSNITLEVDERAPRHKAAHKRSSPASPRSGDDTRVMGSPKWISSSPFVHPPLEIGVFTHTRPDARIAGLNARSPDGYLNAANSGYPAGSDDLLSKELGALNDSSVTALEPLTAFDGTQGSTERETPIETRLVEALRYLEVQPNVGEVVSTTNDWGQTLAHLSILHTYPSLLSHLVDWHINLTIADVNGLTALHYTYMKGDMNSVRILRRGGASETVMDKLGRTPLDLLPEGFDAEVEEIDFEGRLRGMTAVKHAEQLLASLAPPVPGFLGSAV